MGTRTRNMLFCLGVLLALLCVAPGALAVEYVEVFGSHTVEVWIADNGIVAEVKHFLPAGGGAVAGLDYFMNILTDTLTIRGDGQSTNSLIKVKTNVANQTPVQITLENVRIDVRENPPIQITANVNVALTLSGTNTLKANGTDEQPGLQVELGAQFSIRAIDPGDDTSGTLEARALKNAAGIGMHTDQAGTISISSGTVTAVGVGNGAGIGGGASGAGSTVTITGGIVKAYSEGIGAGIGGGERSAGGTVTITGGTVTAYSMKDGAGIGGGGTDFGIEGGAGGTVTITGGTVTAYSMEDGAGIGGGGTNNQGPGPGGAGGTVTITGGMVTAYSGGKAGNAAGIGAGNGGADGTVTITGGTVLAYAGSTSTIDPANAGVGIGGAPITITGGSVLARQTPAATDVSVGSQPTNGSENVYMVTLQVGDPGLANVLVIDQLITGLAYTYGIKDVVTDAQGKVYFWLPEGSYAPLELAASGAWYANAVQVDNSNASEAILAFFRWIPVAGEGGDFTIDYIQLTLTDRVTGVRVFGRLDSTARLNVHKDYLHPEGTCAACDEIRKRNPIAVYDISLSGFHRRPYEVFIPVPGAGGYTVLHCNNGVLEEKQGMYYDGGVTSQWERLSPFAVVAGLSVGVPQSIVVDPPKTGANGAGGWLLTVAVGMLFLLYLSSRRLDR